MRVQKGLETYWKHHVLHLLPAMSARVAYFLIIFWFHRFGLQSTLFLLFGIFQLVLYELSKVSALGVCCKDAFYIFSRFSLTVIDFQGTLFKAFILVGIDSISYLSFGECLSNLFWRVLNLFHTVTVYWLLISQVANEEVLSWSFICLFFYFFIDSGKPLQRRFCDQKILV